MGVHPYRLIAGSRAFNVNHRFVRFRHLRGDGFVEFDFSIGDPRVSVELVMAQNDYRAFCEAHAVVHLTDEEAAALDAEELKWRYGQPGVSE